MRPTFDREEDLLIAYYRSLQATGKHGDYQNLGILLASALLVGAGFYKDDPTWIIVGFVIVAYRLVQGMTSSARFNRTLGSIIEKYEKALDESIRETSKPVAD